MVPIKPVSQLDIDRQLDLKLYPDFWVDLRDCVEVTDPTPTPTPTPSGITDAQAGQAFVALVRWLSTVFAKQ
jgi:hypothetical protein